MAEDKKLTALVDTALHDFVEGRPVRLQSSIAAIARHLNLPDAPPIKRSPKTDRLIANRTKPGRKKRKERKSTRKYWNRQDG